MNSGIVHKRLATDPSRSAEEKKQDLDEALKMMIKSAKIYQECEKNAPPESLDRENLTMYYALAVFNWAMVLGSMAGIEEAEAKFNEAYAVYNKLCGPQHEKTQQALKFKNMC